MAFCPECGSTNQGAGKFCTSCGWQLTGSSKLEIKLDPPPVAFSAAGANSVNNFSQSEINELVWWRGIQPQILVQQCRIVGGSNDREIGALVAQPYGVDYTGNTRVSIPWQSIESVEIIEYKHARGQQRSSFGFGAIGVAFVAATAIANAINSKIEIDHFIRVTTRDKKVAEFFVKGGTDVKWGPIDEVVQRLNKYKELTAPKPGNSQLSVVEELSKLNELRQSGVLTDAEFNAQKSRILGTA